MGWAPRKGTETGNFVMMSPHLGAGRVGQEPGSPGSRQSCCTTSGNLCPGVGVGVAPVDVPSLLEIPSHPPKSEGPYVFCRPEP